MPFTSSIAESVVNQGLQLQPLKPIARLMWQPHCPPFPAALANAGLFLEGLVSLNGRLRLRDSPVAWPHFP